MSKVLQIRRGTTAQNDNFTGLAGEITFDTTAKTLRVHDGATLGGFALARASDIPTIPEPFDITSVPDATWETIFARIAPTPFNVYTSTPITPTNTAYIEHIFTGVSTTPVFVRAVLVCQTDAAGYAAGDETNAFGIGAYCRPMFNTFVDNGNLHVQMAVGDGNFWVVHKTTGAQTNIANNEWRIKFRIYC